MHFTDAASGRSSAVSREENVLMEGKINCEVAGANIPSDLCHAWGQQHRSFASGAAAKISGCLLSDFAVDAAAFINKKGTRPVCFLVAAAVVIP